LGDKTIYYDAKEKLQVKIDLASKNALPKEKEDLQILSNFPKNLSDPQIPEEFNNKTKKGIANQIGLSKDSCNIHFPTSGLKTNLLCQERTLHIVEKMGTYQIPQLKTPKNHPQISEKQVKPTVSNNKSPPKSYFSLRKVVKRLNSVPKKIIRRIILLSSSNLKVDAESTIDTASDVCLIDTRFLKQLGIPADNERGIIIKDLSKSRIPADHCLIYVYFEGEEGPCDFYIYENLEDVVGAPVLIGKDLINGIVEEKGSFSLSKDENKEEFSIFKKENEPPETSIVKQEIQEDILNKNIDGYNFTNNQINVFTIKKEDTYHYNRGFSNNIQNCMKHSDNEIKSFFLPYLSFRKMSQLFGMGNHFFLNIRRLDKANHVIALTELKKMCSTFKNKIKEWIKNNPKLGEKLIRKKLDIIRIIKEYINRYNPKPSPNYQTYNYHPNFKKNYFEVINSKEKAYWLGFLYADGYIGLEKSKYYRCGISLARKDKNILIKFCKAIGLDPKYISNTESSSHFSKKKYPMSTIRWGDQKFAQDLINLGMEYEYVPEKGRRVKKPVLPNLKNRDLMLAFVLGFYDGDGTLRPSEYGISPTIYSSDNKLLLDIRDYFKLNNKVQSRVIERINPRRGILVKTPYSHLSLGSVFFKEMMENYKISLERKRVDKDYFKNYYTGGKKIKIHNNQKEWFKSKIKKEDLEKILETLSPHRISKILGISKRSIIGVADEYNIKYDTSGGQYITISNLIRSKGKDSKYFKPQQFWLKYLNNIGKFNREN